MRLADARALLPCLETRPADPEADRRALERLASWCLRFTPWSAVDGDAGILLDVTGCAHLHGGEEAMTGAIASRLSSLGLEAGIGLADTPGAAWALARFADRSRRIAFPGRAREALEELPVESLRLPSGTSALLRRLGLTTVGALDRIPRAALARRFPSAGDAVLARLDQAFGRRGEPISPLAPAPVFAETLQFAEPLPETGGLLAAAAELVAGLEARLRSARQGALALSLRFFRIDGTSVRIDAAPSRATRDGGHLLRLLADRIGTVDPGFGIDAAALHALHVESLEDEQFPLLGRKRDGDGLGRLIDRLAARLGADAVFRLEPVGSHVPERAERPAPAGRAPASWPRRSPLRPFLLLEPPERVAEGAGPADGPPPFLVWRRGRHRIARAAGPERISPEWWKEDGDVRDYYRVEDDGGFRFWIYREDRPGDGPPRWFLHGFHG